MAKQAKQGKQGKYLWNVTVSETETNFHSVYTLTADSLMRVDFSELAARALSIARKDKGNWHNPANIYVSEIGENGTIDG